MCCSVPCNVPAGAAGYAAGCVAVRRSCMCDASIHTTPSLRVKLAGNEY